MEPRPPYTLKISCELPDRIFVCTTLPREQALALVNKERASPRFPWLEDATRARFCRWDGACSVHPETHVHFSFYHPKYQEPTL